VVLPIVFEGQVKAVMELSSLDRFNPTHQAFLDQLTESIGIVLNTIEANTRTEDLLKQSQSLAGELQNRQEELQTTNQELEQKARQLFEQNEEVEKKNREVEQARQALEGKAQQLSLTSRYKSEFLANMSHELRTPLNSLLILADQLSANPDGNLTAKQVEFARTIRGSGKDLLKLINDILDLSKIEAGKMELYLETFDLNALIDDVASTIRPMVEKNSNELRIERAIDLGGMRADQVKVRQALYNLLSNAAKFTQDGSITLNADRQRMDGEEWIVFQITDTGIGLSAEKIVRLFQDFTQADASTTRKFGGTGLGLALTRRFCQMMGGDVTVHSVDGEGSTFTIKLPAAVHEPKVEFRGDDHSRATDRRRTPDGTNALPAPSTCVLVIDDDPTQRDLMRRFLAKEGFIARSASDGEEGLRLARELMPIAITLDVMMPGMDGWSVLEELKSDPALREIPVIMITMVDDPERGMALGAADYVTKPVNRARLSSILSRYSCANAPCPILLIDDDAATRASMRKMLEKQGCRVAEAENGEVALESMKIERPSLIFLDLMMPVMDGFSFADRVRTHPEWRSIPIVVVTSHDLTGEERRRLTGYVETILHKTEWTRDELFQQIRDTLTNYAVPRAAAV